MTHKDKLRLARKHLTKEEIVTKTSPFQGKYWETRKTRIEKEVAKREFNQKEASRLRKERLTKKEER